MSIYLNVVSLSMFWFYFLYLVLNCLLAIVRSFGMLKELLGLLYLSCLPLKTISKVLSYYFLGWLSFLSILTEVDLLALFIRVLMLDSDAILLLKGIVLPTLKGTFGNICCENSQE
jgi:hypothetical protein